MSCDEDDGLGQIALEPEQLLLQFIADHRVHGAEGFIHEQHRRVGRERPGHADALLLAAGQLRYRLPSAEASPTTSSSSWARLRASALDTPLSRGTVAMLSSTERCGIRPEDCMT